MIDYKSNCAVCKHIKKHKKLADDIYKTTAYDKSSKVSLASLHKIYQDHFSYDSLKNHVKKHQGLSADDLSQRHLNNIVKKAEKELVKKQIEAKDVWETILDLGHEQIKDGSIRLKASDVTRAAKDKSDHDLKVKDQEIAMIEMIYHFASGENEPTNYIGRVDANREIIEAEVADNHPTEESSEDTGAGQEGPSGVYYPPSWNAPTFGTSEVPTGNDKTPNKNKHTSSW